MAIGKVEICGVDTSTLPVISNERMRQLFPLVHGGDMQAREEFIRGNLRLVLSVLQRFHHRGENVDDLFQVGCIGLIKAIDLFDCDKGFCFSTYAVSLILGEVRRHLRDSNPVRVSRSMRDMAYRAMRAREQLQGELSRDPTVGEIAAAIGAELHDVVIALESAREPVSLFDPLCGEGEDAMLVMDALGGEGEEDGWISEISLRQALDRLTERERRILHLRYMRGMTQTEVAGRLGISQAQVSRIEKSIIAGIKKEL